MADDGMEGELPRLLVTTTILPPPSQHHGFQEEQQPRAQATAVDVVVDDDDGHSDYADMVMDDLMLDFDEDFIPLDLDGVDLFPSADDLDEPPSFALIPLAALLPVAASGRRLRFRIRLPTITLPDGEDGGYFNGGFGAVPASAAAVASLEKQEFRASNRSDGAAEGSGAAAGCMICFEEFADGEEVSVMPCSAAHEFHMQCIGKWLGVSNMCPLCRHKLPTAPMA